MCLNSGICMLQPGVINSLSLSYQTSIYDTLHFRIFLFSPAKIIILLFSKPLAVMPRTQRITQELFSSKISFVCKYKAPIKILCNTFSCSISIFHCMSKTLKTSHTPDLKDVTDTQLSMNSYSPGIPARARRSGMLYGSIQLGDLYRASS